MGDRDMSEPMIRWMTQPDLKNVLKIEDQAFPYPWDQDDFEICLRKKNTVGVVMLKEKEVIGYMIFEFKKTMYTVVSLAVSPDHQKNGYGKKLIEYLKQSIRSSKDGPKNKITLVVSDQNLNCHKFLKAISFKATKVVKEYFGPCHDAYEFVHDMQEKKKAPPKEKKKRTRSVKDGME